MEPSRKKALRKYNSELRTGIIVRNILPLLHEHAEGFLTDVEHDRIRSMSDNLEQVDELVVVLLTKENADFDAFCDILERNGYMSCAKKLKDETAGAWGVYM